MVDDSLDIRLRTGDSEAVVTLGPHDLYVVPKGIEHCPVSGTGASVLLIELAGTLSTGDFAGEVPAHITSTTGKEASP